MDEKPAEPKQFDPPPRPSTISKSNDDDTGAAPVKPAGRTNPFAKKVDDEVTKADNDFNWKTSNTTAASKKPKKNDDEEDWDADSDDDGHDGKSAVPNATDKKADDDDDDEWEESKKNENESDAKGWDDEPASPDQKDQPSSPEVNDKQMDWNEEQSKEVQNETPDVPESNQRKRSRSESISSSSSSSDSDADASPKPAKPQADSVDGEIDEPKDVEMKNVEDSVPSEPPKDPETIDEKVETDPEKTDKDDVDKGDSKTEDKVETIDLDKESDTKEEGPVHKALHRTSSIFLRNLAPTITKAEVEAMCKRVMSNGFLRVAIADPLVERRWFRRGWVTFERDVNIKEICWNLNNIRLRDCELGAIVSVHLTPVILSQSNLVFEFYFRSTVISVVVFGPLMELLPTRRLSVVTLSCVRK